MDDDAYDEINICRCVVPHEEESSVNSKTIVKLQTVQLPANFARLQCNTDLNMPPSNWLTNSANSYGLQQALSHSPGFTSFRMAHMFPDCLGEIDVVSSAENIKNLLKLPYSSKSGISMMIHRIENTLLIDEFDIHKYLLRQADDDWKWLKSFIGENVLTSLGDSERRLFIKNKSREALQKKKLLSKFLHYSLSSGAGAGESEPLTETTTATTQTKQQQQLSAKRPPLQLTGPLLPEPSVEEKVPDPKTHHFYNRNVAWTFEDIRMLIGTDMPIFGSANRPCISLRLRDQSQPINVLTGIDYWLDNLMCNVPEVVMCYHLDGLVQKYEIIKTEDLPYLENSNFSPKLIRNVAQNILAFLKQNATKAGHTYWLFKGRNDDFVKLYDLTSLCTNGDTDEATATASGSSSTTANQTNDNPFTVPVAMLLYKVARNMKNMSDPNMSAKQAGSIKTLLDNCIQLLPKEKYPQIVTSSHYILSDLHVPTSINPNAPNFSWSDESTDETQAMYDDEHQQPSQADMDGELSTTAAGQAMRASESPRRGSIVDCVIGENVSIKNISETLNEFNTEKNWKHNSSPPPIVGNVTERCQVALQHIADGLDCLQYFSQTEEKLTQEKEKIAKEEEKRKIILEELNPNMAKSHQAIPLPYEKLKAEPISVDPSKPIPMGWKTDAPSMLLSAASKKSKKNRRKTAAAKRLAAACDAVGDAEYNDFEEAVDSPRSLLLKGKSGVIESWNVHLKLLLLEKTCLTYATLTEHAYHNEQYGTSLRYICLAMQAQLIVTKHMSSVSSQKQCLLGRAGDCYFQMAKNVDTIAMNLADFGRCNAVDMVIRRELDKHMEASAGDETSDNCRANENEWELPAPTNNIEQLMVSSCACYESALACSTAATSRREFVCRLGSVRNELGIRYMHWAQQEYARFVDGIGVVQAIGDSSGVECNAETAEPQPEELYQTFVKKSYDCLVRGVAAFEEIGDNANLAILMCNMGRFMRFRAHVIMFNESETDIALKRQFYDFAFKSYNRALAILETRKQNPVLWDLVVWELSTGTFTLVQHMIDHISSADMTDQIEQEIIKLLMGALKLCDTETPSDRQVLYAFRTASLYHRLAKLYDTAYWRTTAGGSSSCMPSNDDDQDIDGEARRKKLLQLSRLYYEKSVRHLEQLGEPKEFLQVQCDRLALQNRLAEAASMSTARMRHYQTALDICLQSSPIFDGITDKLEFAEDIGRLLETFERLLQATLRNLIKCCLTKGGASVGADKLAATYKHLYSLTLRRPADYSDVIELGAHMRYLLETIRTELQSTVAVRSNE